jgi:hypothetical protein
MYLRPSAIAHHTRAGGLHTLVRVNLLRVHVHDVCRHRVEEVSVMRHLESSRRGPLFNDWQETSLALLTDILRSIK